VGPSHGRSARRDPARDGERGSRARSSARGHGSARGRVGRARTDRPEARSLDQGGRELCRRARDRERRKGAARRLADRDSRRCRRPTSAAEAPRPPHRREPSDHDRAGRLAKGGGSVDARARAHAAEAALRPRHRDDVGRELGRGRDGRARADARPARPFRVACPLAPRRRPAARRAPHVPAARPRAS
jgi:hypothetical protein